MCVCVPVLSCVCVCVCVYVCMRPCVCVRACVYVLQQQYFNNNNSVRIKFVNTVIIFMKYGIYKSRQKGSLPTLVKIEKCVLEFIEEEKKLAIKNRQTGDALVKVGICKLSEGRGSPVTTLFLFFLFFCADLLVEIRYVCIHIPIFMSCISFRVN